MGREREIERDEECEREKQRKRKRQKIRETEKQKIRETERPRERERERSRKVSRDEKMMKRTKEFAKGLIEIGARVNNPWPVIRAGREGREST